MIYGIGTDIVDITRIAAIHEQHGDRFARRILTARELLEYTHAALPVKYLAKRFAAKEAAAKAMGVGFRDGLWLSHIGVSNDALGKPELYFETKAQEILTRLGIGQTFISLADEKFYAIAYVVMLHQKP